MHQQLQGFCISMKKENGELFDITVYTDGGPDRPQISVTVRPDPDGCGNEIHGWYVWRQKKSVRWIPRLSLFLSRTWHSMRSVDMQWMPWIMFEAGFLFCLFPAPEPGNRTNEEERTESDHGEYQRRCRARQYR